MILVLMVFSYFSREIVVSMCFRKRVDKVLKKILWSLFWSSFGFIDFEINKILSWNTKGENC